MQWPASVQHTGRCCITSCPGLCPAYCHVNRSCLQDAKAGTIPADPLMQALLEQYLKRLSVNRATLTALFKAADSDNDGLLDRPQSKAALMCARKELTDTDLTTVWLEREKVCAVCLLPSALCHLPSIVCFLLFVFCPSAPPSPPSPPPSNFCLLSSVICVLQLESSALCLLWVAICG